MPPPTDDAIREMLESRAGRAGQVRFDTSAVAAEAIRRAGSEPRPVPLMPRLAVAVTSLAAVLVLAVIVAVPLGNRPASASPTLVPSGVAPATPTGDAPQPTPIPSPRVLSPAELGELARTRSTELAGTIVAVSGRLERDPSIACARGTVCADTLLANSGGGFHIKPVGDIGSGPWDGSGGKDGVFAVQITANLDGGEPVVEYIGDLAHRDDGTLAVSVADILGGQIQMEGPYAAVDGWLVRSALHPCPMTKQVFIPTYGCPTDDWLTEEAYQPTQTDGSIIGPGEGIYLPTGSYDQWAPNPARLGPAGLGVEPRRATYLMWLVASSSCGPNADCFDGPANLQSRIVGRFDPIPNLATPPTHPPDVSSPPVVTGTYPGGIPRSIGSEPVLIGLDQQQHLANTTDATTFLVGGWFDSHIMNMCSGGFGPSDPNPLGARGCSRYQVGGVAGRLFVPATLTMPEVDQPIVMRVHTHDSGAETCWDVAACSQRLVVDEVVWSGDSTTAAGPLGPNAAVSALQGVAFADQRPQPDNTIYYVDEDIYTLPIACPAPWPTLLFGIHGDPRLGLLAVFADPAARETFQRATDPAGGASCLADGFERPGQPRWIGLDNMLVLVFGDEATAAAIEKNLALPIGDEGKKIIPLPDAGLDLSMETLTDYLAARATGETDHAAGERLVLRQPDDESFDVFAGWQVDSLRRLAANALDGTVTLLSDNPTEADIGADLWRLRPKDARLWVYRVDYLDASDSTLASETFVVIQDPNSTFQDWQITRIAGDPYPRIAIPPPVVPPPGVMPDVAPIPGNNGSGDTPCLPAGEPCG